MTKNKTIVCILLWLFFLMSYVCYADTKIKEITFDINGRDCLEKISTINIDGRLFVPSNGICKEMNLNNDRTS